MIGGAMGRSAAENAKKVLFVIEDSPTDHLRAFEAMRMALGFSVTHHGMKILLRGRGVLALREVHPGLISLPPELVEVLPLLGDLSVGLFADADSVRLYLPGKSLPGGVSLLSEEEVVHLLGESDLVLGFWSRGKVA